MGTLPTAVGPLGLKLGCNQQQVTPPAQRPLRLSPRASQAPGTALPGQLNLNVLRLKRLRMAPSNYFAYSRFWSNSSNKWCLARAGGAAGQGGWRLTGLR